MQPGKQRDPSNLVRLAVNWKCYTDKQSLMLNYTQPLCKWHLISPCQCICSPGSFLFVARQAHTAVTVDRCICCKMKCSQCILLQCKVGCLQSRMLCSLECLQAMVSSPSGRDPDAAYRSRATQSISPPMIEYRATTIHYECIPAQLHVPPCCCFTHP